MKKLTLLILAGTFVLSAQAVTHIGVSIGINAPGQYGRIDINNYPQPTLVHTHPIVHAPSPISIHQRPIYLYVPHTHQANWGRYCGRYSACGQPVYFVQQTWVQEEYRREHDNRDGHKRVKNKDRKKYKDKGEDRGHGHGKDNGKGKGKGNSR